ncbi:GNAT family N-acetyltransferase [Microbulbifer sp. ANSA001]|uniref:GNAT family N-acetyltransferase n=1 Tax=Microbulbifer sp. ANSA001 TaxID=3243358 RepID=UPI00404371D0
MEIRPVRIEDAEGLSGFYSSNADHLRQWEPARGSGYHSLGAWQQRLQGWHIEQQEGRGAYFLITFPESSRVVATCSLTNIVCGPFQACNMGYAVDKSFEGKGVMYLLCEYVIAFAFKELGLNRVMANYMPENYRSAALLRRLGFVVEGNAKRYLLINGRWEDHVLTALVKE